MVPSLSLIPDSLDGFDHLPCEQVDAVGIQFWKVSDEGSCSDVLEPDLHSNNHPSLLDHRDEGVAKMVLKVDPEVWVHLQTDQPVDPVVQRCIEMGIQPANQVEGVVLLEPEWAHGHQINLSPVGSRQP